MYNIYCKKKKSLELNSEVLVNNRVRNLHHSTFIIEYISSIHPLASHQQIRSEEQTSRQTDEENPDGRSRKMNVYVGDVTVLIQDPVLSSSFSFHYGKWFLSIPQKVSSTTPHTFTKEETPEVFISLFSLIDCNFQCKNACPFGNRV